MFAVQFRRAWLSLLRSKDEALNPLVFLFLAASLFAIGFGGASARLAEAAPAIIWVLVLLANLLSLEALFRRDFEDGALEQFVLCAQPQFAAVLGKVAVHWCASGLAMTLLAPLLALLLNLPAAALPALLLGLLLGTPALSLIGAIGAALTVGLGGGVLLALLLAPLHLPVLVFGVSATLDGAAGLAAKAQLYWLAAISALALTLAPFATAAALRISVQRS